MQSHQDCFGIPNRGRIPSQVQLNTTNGFGSTANKIARFVNSKVTGNDMLFIQSAVNGDQIQVLSDGLYFIVAALGANSSSTAGDTGIILNSLQLGLGTSSPQNIGYANNIGWALFSGSGGFVGNQVAIFCGYLEHNSMITIQGGFSADTAAFSYANMCRIG